jgi:peptide/nickel transport system substrate-binding protein
VTLACLVAVAFCHATQQISGKAADRRRSSDEPQIRRSAGTYGGTLVTAQRSEPRSFNPVTALDTGTREVLGLMHADLIHINRKSGQTEPALARSWEVSRDGMLYTVHLHRGLRFSDNHGMDADDVVFTFKVHLDEKTASTQRDLLFLHGKPIQVEKVDQYTVRFRLSVPYAAAERLFDGIAILPRHLLSEAYENGQLSAAWQVDTKPAAIAGMGPFRLKSYASGQRVVLERNPFYWKADSGGRRLPYLDAIVIQIIATEDAQAIRFQSGELDVVNTLAADTFVSLRRSGTGLQRVHDAGPGLEYNFLVFNLNDKTPSSTVRGKQKWFRSISFRRAVSAVIDRQSVVRLVYRGLGESIDVPVTEGNPLWINRNLRQQGRSLERARQLLREAAFSWENGALVDPEGQRVSFTILVSASSSQRGKMATIVQDDLRQLGMQVSVVSADARAVQDRILNRQDYEAALMALASGDADPNSDINVWSLDGGLRMWNMAGTVTDWERELDTLMRQQMLTVEYKERKRMYDRVQELVARHLPIICIASPHVLIGASTRVRGFQPAVLRPYALWNADELYVTSSAGAR